MERPIEHSAPLILVVDDNPSSRMLVRDTLEAEGHRVVLAEGGMVALQRFEREPADCVLLDVRMPDLDGFAACERIRKLPGGAEIPVVFLTALRDVDTFDRALHAGGDDFLTKPIRPTELVSRVRAALELRRMRAELRGHYELLKRQRDDLIRIQLQKERLMAFVVHDLKAPVVSMDLQAQVLLAERGLSQHVSQCAQQIRSEARQLNRMIINLLDVSKADEGRLVAQRIRVDTHKLLLDVLEDLRLRARERDVHLRSEIELQQVWADEDLLRRTLSNLIDNAIRHAPRGSLVRVLVMPHMDGSEFRVIDSGSGVAEAMRDRVFEPFVQLIDKPGHRHAGRGLGLAFCRLAVEAHGGRIWVDDAGPGAAFCFRLPCDS
jgi:signal transduction histidine kinase